MSERTAIFFASLSHRWLVYLLIPPVVFGLIMRAAGVIHARVPPGGVLRRFLMVARFLSGALIVASLALFGVGFIHIGCAAIVAHSSQCLSNIKRLEMGISMYSQLYDERLPLTAAWCEAIRPRVKEASSMDDRSDPFRCPVAESPGSYGMNAAVGGISTAEIPFPAETVLLFDADAPVCSFAGGPQDVALTRHNGAPNVGFTDGHVKWANAHFRKQLIWTPTEVRHQR